MALEGFQRSSAASRLSIIEIETMESFERLHYYMQPVPEEVVREALGE